MADARSFIATLISASFLLLIAAHASGQAPAGEQPGQAVQGAKAVAEKTEERSLYADPVFVIMFGIGVIVLVMGVAVTYRLANPARNNPESSLEVKQLHFAAASLTGLMLIFALAMAMVYWGGQKATPIFDTTKTIIPPIVTLILGYYFGKTEKKPEGPAAPTPDGQADPTKPQS